MKSKYDAEAVDQIKLRADTMRMITATSLWVGIGPYTAAILGALMIYWQTEMRFGYFASSLMMMPSFFLLLCGFLSMKDFPTVPVDTSNFGVDEHDVKRIWKSYLSPTRVSFPTSFIKGYFITGVISNVAFVMPSIDVNYSDFVTMSISINLSYLLIYMVFRGCFYHNVRDAHKRLEMVRNRCIFEM